jgi:uncharacterized membrane protein YccC
MTPPTWRQWLFSAKAFAAACLALYIALWIDLPRPYWAMTTVYVVSQPFVGTTLSKALYRLLGTTIGGIAAVTLVPNLVNSPELLTAALALWTALCVFLSQLDRRPHSYIFMLAGYTAPIIGFPAVDDPGAIFTTAIARVQEIGLGIVCASVVGALFMPQSVAALFGQRVKGWLHNASDWAQEVLGPSESVGPETARARLAADAIEIDLLAAHLGFEVGMPHGARRWADMLRARMLLLLPLTSSIASRLRALPANDLTPALRTAMTDLRAWLSRGAPPSEATALRSTISAAAPPLDASAQWPDLLHANLAVRLRDLVDLQSDCGALHRHLLGERGQPHLLVPDIDSTNGSRARHVDVGVILWSSAAAALAITIGAAFWIISGWPEGSSLPVMAAVACSFFAGLDNPVAPQLSFARWSLVSVLISGGYVFAVLPMVHDFTMLMMVLAPPLLLAGVVATYPATMLVGLAVAANTPTLIGLQSRYSADFATFANGGMALVGGLSLGALVTWLARVVQPQWMAQRLLRASWRAVAQAAEQRGHGNRALFASRMLDRAGQLAPRLALGVAWPDMVMAVRVGLNVVELRRARRQMVPATRGPLDAVLDGISGTFRALAGQRSPHAPLSLATLDTALRQAVTLAPGLERDDLLQGLIGLRLALFADAPAYADPAPSIDAAPTVPFLQDRAA